MIIVADSGSTKADWKIVGPKGIETISTMGFNPVFHSDDQIFAEVEKAFEGFVPPDSAEAVHFYGSGCWDYKRKLVISTALSRYFTKAEIEVQHDLLAAARATCGNDPGIACILGTGSNTCLFDGHEVVDNVTNLGYLLGDEGSGTHLGKKLIRAYFYRELPAELAAALEVLIPGGKSEILDQIYGRKETPNVYLASFTRFLAEHKSHYFVQKLLYRSFSEFIDRHVRKYPGHLSLPVHFIGSVAYYFQDTVRMVLAERTITCGQFIKKPIDQLVQFHLESVN